MSTQKMHFKEKLPDETTEYLQNILKKNKIHVVEEWQNESSVGTYALRLFISGTGFGSNGKGVTKSFARASAYAELIERLQNDLIGDLNVTSLPTKYSFKLYYDEKFLTAEKLIKIGGTYLDYYFSNRCMNSSTMEEKATHFKKVQKLDKLYFDVENSYLSIPYFSLKEKKLKYLPRNVYRLSYGSNGMSAGNSFEEAMVQGLSEIIERFVQRKIFDNKIILPDIPNEYIKKFPDIYKMVSKLKKNTSYTYLLKDCSLGGRYPVAGLIVIQKNTGRFGVKLGCHPDFGIAMERAFTEAAQGQDIFNYSQRSKFDFYNNNVFNDINIYNTFKTGFGQYPYEFFNITPTFKFCETSSVEDLTNKEIMDKMCNEILNEGFDILVRDVSYLGFTSLHIIIPTMSEMFIADDQRYRIYNTRYYINELLKKPENINRYNVKYIISVLEYFMPSVLENTLKTYYDWCDCKDIPFEKYGLGIFYLLSMCYIILKEFKKASKYLDYILKYLEENSLSQNNDYYFCQALDYYLNGLDIGKTSREIMHYLTILFDDSVSKKVDDLMREMDKVILKQYPNILNYPPISKEQAILIRTREKVKESQLRNKINQNDLFKKFEKIKREKYITKT